MAVRLTLRDETGVTVAVVSADDADETLLVSTLALLAKGAPVFTAERHGDGAFDPSDVRELTRVTEEVTVGQALSLAETVDQTAQVVRWLAALHQGLSGGRERGAGLGWEMSYDRGGSVDDGEHEYATEAHAE